jgi:hypothetical protein
MGPLDHHGAFTLAADSTTQPVNRVLPLTFTVFRLGEERAVYDQFPVDQPKMPTCGSAAVPDTLRRSP